MRISRARKVEIVLRDLGRRYAEDDPLQGEGTTLAKITAETEDPFKVLIGTILSQRTRDEKTEVASRRLFARYGTVDTMPTPKSPCPPKPLIICGSQRLMP